MDLDLFGIDYEEMTEEQRQEMQKLQEEFEEWREKELKKLLGEKNFIKLFETETGVRKRFIQIYKTFICDKKDIANMKEYTFSKFPKKLNITNLQGYYEYYHSWDCGGACTKESLTIYCFVKIKDKYITWTV